MASSLGSAATAGRRRPSRPEIIFALVAAAVPDDFEVSASEADHVLSECGFDRKTIDAIMQYLREVETVSACAKCCTSAHKKGRNKIPRPGRCHCVCTGGGAGATVCSPRIHRDDMHDTPSSHSVERNAIAQMLLPSPQRLFFVSTDQDDRHGVPAQGRRHNAERMSGRSLSGSFSSSAPGHMLTTLEGRSDGREETKERHRVPMLNDAESVSIISWLRRHQGPDTAKSGSKIKERRIETLGAASTQRSSLSVAREAQFSPANRRGLRQTSMPHSRSFTS